jgi:dTDP-4-dehydrorhamnose 3,5-epimerase
VKVIPTKLEEVLLLEPQSFEDPRGYFMEIFQARRYTEIGIHNVFVQDNLSCSVRSTLRGLHFQHPNPQAKLVQAVSGEIFDVAVDIRRGSPTFGQWAGAILSDQNHRQLFIPEGFAHGFCVLSERAHFLYKCSALYSPKDEGGLRWDDPEIAVDWPIAQPLLSERDKQFPSLKQIAAACLPRL